MGCQRMSSMRGQLFFLMSSDCFSPALRHKRNAAVFAGVVLAHGAALWALQGALSHQKAPEVIVPAVLLSEFLAPPTPPAPAPPKPAPAAPLPPIPVPRPAKAAPKPRPAPVRAPAPTPTPIADAASEAPVAPAPTVAPAPAGAPALPPAPASPPSPAAPPAPPRIDLPSSNAAYLNNPAPAYPSISKRMGEQGKVLLRVLISADGRPDQVEIKQSSGFDRLDRQARDTVLRWRFVPGKRNGVAEAMWYLVPINFVLE